MGQGGKAGLGAKAWLCPFLVACPMAGKTIAVKNVKMYRFSRCQRCIDDQIQVREKAGTQRVGN